MTDAKKGTPVPFQKSISTANLQSVVVGDSATTANFQSVAAKVPAAAPAQSTTNTAASNGAPKK